MSTRRYTLAMGVAALAIHAAAGAQASDAARVLLEQGQYWQARDNTVRASEAWNKLLLLEPGQPDALYGLARLELRAKRPAGARNYLAQLKAKSPNSPLVPQLEQDIQLAGGSNAAALAKARLDAEGGKLDDAIAQYDAAFAGRPPTGALALEYYAYLGYTANGWTRAREGLERLAAQSPNDVKVQLELAKLLTRNESTRLTGIRQLQPLSARPDVGGEAGEALRGALVWLGSPRPSDVPLFQAYLADHPDDTEIREQMQSAGRQAATRAQAGAGVQRDPGVARGFASLDANDLATADAQFQARLRTQPDDADALGGLGVVRQKQDRLDDARTLLTQAAAKNPRWRGALRSVDYWLLIQRAADARNANDLAGAERFLQEAQKLDSGQSAALAALGDIQAERGDLAGAERSYRSALSRDPADVQALQGWVTLLAGSGRLSEAKQAIDGYASSRNADVAQVSRMRAAYATGLAKAATARGDEAGARAALEQALQDDNSNVWVRLELARLYVRAGRVREARGLVDGLMAREPANRDARYASAMLAADLREWDRAAALLEGIPETARSGEIQALQRSVWINQTAAQASALAKQGRRDQAIALLGPAQRVAGQDAALVGVLASAYVDAGQSAQAIEMIRGLMARSPSSNTDAQLQYAGILLKTDQDVEAGQLLRALQSRPLTASQRAAYEDIRFLYVVRQAESQRASGDLVAAYDTLAPALAERPRDATAVGALARMYSSAGQNDKALALYKPLIESDPDNVDLQLGAAQAANQAKDYRYAAGAADTAVALAPENIEVLTAAARIYRAQGKSSAAMALLEKAVALQGQSGAPVAMASGEPSPAAPRSTNPFVGLPGQRTVATAPTSYPDSRLAIPVPAYDVGASNNVAQYAPRDVLPGDVSPYASRSDQSYASPNNQPYAPRDGQPYASRNDQSYTQGQTAAAPLNNTTYTPYPSPVATGAPVGDPEPTARARSTGRAQAPLSAAAELDDIRQERSPEIRVGTQVRTRNGEGGTSKLTAVETPMEVRFPVGDDRMNVRVTPVSLDAGRVAGGYYGASTFGGGPQAALGQLDGLTRAPGAQRDTGVGMSVGYETRGIAVDAGVTPVGFRYSTFTGGVKFDGTLDDADSVSYMLNVSRRPVTDSVLSFAGARDSRTGQSWGGVSATGARGQLVKDFGDFGVYGGGAFHDLSGHNVASNTRSEASAGVYYHIIRRPDEQLTTGVNASAVFYDKNQRYFTYGHGGYFSPQRYYAFSVPLNWSQRTDRFTYQVSGSLGLQRFTEDEADYFPGNRNLQNQAQIASASAMAQGMTGFSNAVYSGQSKTGLGYSLFTAGEYQMAPQVFLGGSMALDNSSDYRQWAGGLYLRYAFYPQRRPLALPVVPFRSPYGE